MIDNSKCATCWYRATARQIGHFTACRNGSLGVTFAAMIVPITLAIGSCLDYIAASDLRDEMQTYLDAALVAAVQDVGIRDPAALEAQINNWIEAESAARHHYALDTASLAIDSAGEKITARLTTGYETLFMRIAGYAELPVAVSSSVIGGKTVITKNAMSMYFVLDRSGSMGEKTATAYTTNCTKGKLVYTCTRYYTRLESLQLAVSDLMAQFDLLDPELRYVRTGAVSYSDKAQSPSALDWGTEDTRGYVGDLTASGYTNSGEAMGIAYDSLVDRTDTLAHLNRTGITPKKFIVLMTDGENNVSGADEKTRDYCDKARAAGMVVYSVAFMAPIAGETLLKYCATSPGHYYNADSTAELVAAFKAIGASSAKLGVRLLN